VKKLAPTAIRGSLTEDGLLRPWPDAAHFLSVSRTQIYELLASGKIEYVRITDHGARKIPRRALVRYLDSRIVKPGKL